MTKETTETDTLPCCDRKKSQGKMRTILTDRAESSCFHDEGVELVEYLVVLVASCFEDIHSLSHGRPGAGFEVELLPTQTLVPLDRLERPPRQHALRQLQNMTSLYTSQKYDVIAHLTPDYRI